jgi:hypothetical protein
LAFTRERVRQIESQALAKLRNPRRSVNLQIHDLRTIKQKTVRTTWFLTVFFFSVLLFGACDQQQIIFEITAQRSS